MSNPAVIKLQRKKLNGQTIWLDDNFGEAIHIHVDNIRVDLTVKEFEQLCSDICDAINAFVGVEGFDCHSISPTYFEVMLWKDLTKLRAVIIENVPLKKMVCPTSNGIRKLLPDSRGVNALNGDTAENDKRRASHFNGQSSSDRLEAAYDSIKENGYPYENEYIIMYGNDNIIRDGQHRASCLWKLYGDVEVPVMRFIFEGYTTPAALPIWKRNQAYKMAKSMYYSVKDIKQLYRTIKRWRRNIQRKKMEHRRKRYIDGHKEIAKMQKIFDEK